MPDVSYLLYELLVDPEQLLRVLQLDRDTVLVISRPRGNVVTRAPGPGRLLSRVTCHHVTRVVAGPTCTRRAGMTPDWQTSHTLSPSSWWAGSGWR